MDSIVNLKSFQDRFVSGLVFSMLEGLSQGSSVVFQSENPMDSFREELLMAKITDIKIFSPQKKSQYWELVVSKPDQRSSVGIKDQGLCCGICGNDK